MSIICLILAQGAFYWHLKLQAIYTKRPTLPPYFHRTFSLFRQVNVALLSLYVLLMIYGWITQLINFVPSFWSTALFLFAVLEYVNYYHYQLSHDNWNDIRFLIKHKKIRRSPCGSIYRRPKTGRKAYGRLHGLSRGVSGIKLSSQALRRFLVRTRSKSETTFARLSHRKLDLMKRKLCNAPRSPAH